MTARSIGYWITTAIVVFAIGSGGIGELTHQWGTLETVTLLGYPLYFLTIIGTCKILGAIALVAPRWPRLTEWAYAGIVFNLLGALASHVLAGDDGVYASHLLATGGLAGLALGSWALRPPSSRYLGDRSAQQRGVDEGERLVGESGLVAI